MPAVGGRYTPATGCAARGETHTTWHVLRATRVRGSCPRERSSAWWRRRSCVGSTTTPWWRTSNGRLRVVSADSDKVTAVVLGGCPDVIWMCAFQYISYCFVSASKNIHCILYLCTIYYFLYHLFFNMSGLLLSDFSVSEGCPHTECHVTRAQDPQIWGPKRSPFMIGCPSPPVILNCYSTHLSVISHACCCVFQAMVSR